MQINKNLMGSSAAHLGHVLLISPLTFSYHTSISECLNSLGYKVTWWDDRLSNATFFKLALRLFPALIIRLSERFFLKQLSQLDAAMISHVLVIKGEGLSNRVLFNIREYFPSASMGLYLWDSTENVKSVFNILPAFDSVATFDPTDAKTFGWTYRPLFWRKNSVIDQKLEEKMYDWCFIGTIHSDRHRVIHKLRQSGSPHMTSFVFAYFQSPLLFFIRCLFDWTLWLAPSETLSTKPMPADWVAQKVAITSAVLDVEHPRQRGLTMRTIETLMAGKKLVTTNKHIFMCDLYHPSRIQVISRTKPQIPQAFIEQPFLSIPDQLRSYYSCKGWVSELIELQDTAKKRMRLSV